MNDESYPDTTLLPTRRAAAAIACVFEPLAEHNTPTGRWATGVLFGLVMRQLSIGVDDLADGPDIDVPLSTLPPGDLTALSGFFADPVIYHHETREWLCALVKMLDAARFAEMLGRLDCQSWEAEMVTGTNAEVTGLPGWREISKPGED